MSGKLPGMMFNIAVREVTADDRGHVFVCDSSNKYIHVLSTRDGSHLGVAAGEGEEGVGRPCKVAWHGESASLIVADQRDIVYHLNVFSRQD